MKYHKRKAAVALALLVIGAVAVVAYVTDRRRRVVPNPVKKAVASRPASPTQGRGNSGKARQRNLSLQPEALAVARRLGTRFGHGNRAQSTVVGALTIGTETLMVRTVRTQTDDGEQIEIALSGRGGAMTWDRNGGAMSGESRAHGPDRDLIERLVFDSPDQFVLAQLRGASYFTVARNVRSDAATEGSPQVLWNIVRVSDPERDEGKRPLSSWRLYHINTVTGLIDRIESDVNGERTVAELTGWMDMNGEKVPTEITWSREGHRVMHYRLTNFSHSAQ